LQQQQQLDRMMVWPLHLVLLQQQRVRTDPKGLCGEEHQQQLQQVQRQVQQLKLAAAQRHRLLLPVLLPLPGLPHPSTPLSEGGQILLLPALLHLP
jgi:hypothetical protein